MEVGIKLSDNWLDAVSKGKCRTGIEAVAMRGLKVVQSHEGYKRCSIVVSDRITDADGNWHVGAMATAMDCVAATVLYSISGHVKASVDFSISYFSTAKLQDEVEIDAKVVGGKGKIASVVIEVRRKDNGDLIALGKQWMASRNNVKKVSKL